MYKFKLAKLVFRITFEYCAWILTTWKVTLCVGLPQIIHQVMHPTECMMSFVQTVHVRNSSFGGSCNFIIQRLVGSPE